jgi:hypothetical protein
LVAVLVPEIVLVVIDDSLILGEAEEDFEIVLDLVEV